MAAGRGHPLLFQLRNHDLELIHKTLSRPVGRDPEKLAALDAAFPDGGVFLAFGFDRNADATAEATLTTRLGPASRRSPSSSPPPGARPRRWKTVMKARLEGAAALQQRAVEHGQAVSGQVRMPSGLEPRRRGCRAARSSTCSRPRTARPAPSSPPSPASRNTTSIGRATAPSSTLPSTSPASRLRSAATTPSIKNTN